MNDRWRIVESIGYPDNRLDPYAGNNPVKGDRPVFGSDGYAAITVTSNSLLEPRRVPVPSGGGADQVFFNQAASFDLVLYQGDTVFRPPDHQFRFTPTINYSRTQAQGAATGSTTFSAQALFFEKHLRDTSARYDFDSARVGIQPLTTDFRGFLMLDQPLGVRLFGTRANNLYQYNLGWFRPLAKNVARQNDLGTAPPHEDVVLANLYRQDFLRPGFTAALIAVYDRNRSPGAGLLADAGIAAGTAPTTGPSARDHDIAYVGTSWDGHFGRINATGAAYFAGGHESPGLFSLSDTAVRAGFGALELSTDFDWIRTRLSALFASGDAHPEDRRATGFAALNGIPLFAGADSSFFLHQRLPLTDSIDLKQRDRLFEDLRGSSAGGPASFSGPGLRLLGIGIDLDPSSRLRVSLDANHIEFAQTASLALLTGKSAVPHDIGQDFSINAFFRPLNNQNIILRMGGAILTPGGGYRSLYGNGTPYSASCNLILTY